MAAANVLLQLLEPAAEHGHSEVVVVLVADQLRRQVEDGKETMVSCLVARHERSLVDREHVVDHLAVLFDPVGGDVGSDRAYFRELSEFFKLTLSDSQLAWVAPEPTQEKKTQLSPEKGPERLLTASGSSSNKEGNILTTMTLTEGDRGSTIPGSRDQPGGNRDPKHAKNGQFSM